MKSNLQWILNHWYEEYSNLEYYIISRNNDSRWLRNIFSCFWQTQPELKDLGQQLLWEITWLTRKSKRCTELYGRDKSQPLCVGDKQRNLLLVLGLRPGPSVSQLCELLEGRGWMSQNRKHSWEAAVEHNDRNILSSTGKGFGVQGSRSLDIHSPSTSTGKFKHVQMLCVTRPWWPVQANWQVISCPDFGLF